MGEINNSSWHTILEKLGEFEFRKGISSFVNPFSMLQLEENPDLANGINYWYVDGISLTKLLKTFFNIKVKRFSFDDTSVSPLVFSFAKKNNLSVAIIGTEQEFVTVAVDRIEKKHGIKIDYFRNGYFSGEEEVNGVIKQILERKIKIVVCGMGTPHQEKFLIKLQNAGWLGYGFTCGGYLHQLAKKEKYYPPFFDKYNVRWVYRIYDEPKLLKRYFFKYPLFLLKFLLFYIKETFINKNKNRN